MMKRSAALRSNVPIWIARHAQALIVLGVFWATIWDVVDWHDIGCSKPRRVDANATCVVAATPLVLYLIASTGRTRFSCLYWHPILQIAMDALLLPVWLYPAAGAAAYNCRSVCTVCRPKTNQPLGFYAWVGKKTCSCFVSAENDINAGGVDKAVQITRQTTLRPGRGEARTKLFSGAKRIPLVHWTQWVMVALIVITLVRSIWILCQAEKENDLYTFVEDGDRQAMELFKDKRNVPKMRENGIEEEKLDDEHK